MHTKILEKIFFVLVVLTFFVPLLVVPGSFIFPFIVPKILAFRTLVLLMGGVYALLLVQDRKRYMPRASAALWALMVFFASFCISTFAGVDWYRSFWDNHERMLGLFTIAHFVLYAIMLSAVVQTKEQWTKLLRWFLGAGSLVMLIGVWQKLVDPEFLLNKNSPRVSATLGNAIYYSGYGLFLLFTGVFLLLQKKYQTVEALLVNSSAIVLAAVLGFVGILFGGTRGTLVGLLAGLAVAFGIYAFQKKYPNLRKISLVAIACGAVAVALIFSFRTTPFVQSIPGIGRLANTAIGADTANTRIMAWGIALDAWQDKPVFGWGPNNYYYAFNQYYRPQFLRYGFGETWFDNAHNAVMNTLATQGALGLLAYLSLFIGAGLAIWRMHKRGAVTFHAAVATTAFLVAHFVHSFFVFENPTSYMYFMVILGYIMAQGRAEASTDATPQSAQPLSIGAVVVVGLVVVLFIYATDVNPRRANGAAFRTIQQLYAFNPNSLEVYREAKNTPTPHIDDVRNDITRTIGSLVPKFIERKASKEAKALLDESIADLEDNIRLHPLDVRVYLQKAQLVQQYVETFKAPERFEEVITTLEKARELSPKRQQVVYSLAPAYAIAGRAAEGEALMRQAVMDDPSIAESWWRLAYMYEVEGSHAKALATLDEAEQTYQVKFEPGTLGASVVQSIRAK